MNFEILLPLAATGFGVAFMHSALPVHWLPIVLSARAQKWTVPKTAAVTTLVSGGHVFLTMLLGFFIVLVGSTLGHSVEKILPSIETGLLIAIGVFYLWRQQRHQGHVHLLSRHHHHHDHSQCTLEAGGVEESPFQAEMKSLSTLSPPKKTSDFIAVGSLFALMTFSPCESFLPIYLAGIPHGWFGFAILSIALALAALIAFLLFTTLTLLGAARFQMKFLGRFENAIVGIIFIVLGVVRILAPTHAHHHG